jgi:hypothetical protein
MVSENENASVLKFGSRYYVKVNHPRLKAKACESLG